MLLKTKQGKYVLAFLYVLSISVLIISCNKHEINGNVESVETREEIDISGIDLSKCSNFYAVTSERRSDSGKCPCVPGFCPDDASMVLSVLNETDEDKMNFREGGDAIVKVSLNNESNILSLRHLKFREGWFEEGGHFDGKFVTPKLVLNKELTELLGKNRITLLGGTYAMTEDKKTGNYLVSINVKTE